jgi:Type II intron maturase
LGHSLSQVIFCVQGVISPILANIYLHELDEFMAKMKADFDCGKTRRMNPAGKALSREIENRRNKIKRRKQRGDESEIPSLLAEIKTLTTERRNVPYSDWFDPNFRRILYCRYADDFLIGIIGSKADARAVMQNIQHFLNASLKLAISPEKSGIRKASKGTVFLGYTVRTHTANRVARKLCGGRSVVARIASDRVQLHAPQNNLAKFAERQRLGSYHTNRGSMRPEFCNYSDIEIIARYNALMRGIAEYYKLGTSWRNEVGRLYHVWWRSLINSLARKYKCSAPMIIQRLRHGNEYGVWYESRTGKRFWPVFALKHVNAAYLPRKNVDDLPTLYIGERTDLLDRLHAATCEACGAEGVPVEIHHARRLKDAQHLSLQARVKAARTRKRIVLCVPCHRAHHMGRLQARLDAMNASIGAG